MGFTIAAIAVLLIGIGVGVWFLIDTEPAASPTAVSSEFDARTAAFEKKDAIEAGLVARASVQTEPLAAMDELLIERAFVQTEPLAAMDELLIERAFVQTESLAAMDELLIERITLPTAAETRAATFDKKDAIEEGIALKHAWTDPFEKNR
ncbi:MAG: hypothetical protein ABFS21_06220 [Actinomycetota bacterium]